MFAAITKDIAAKKHSTNVNADAEMSGPLVENDFLILPIAAESPPNRTLPAGKVRIGHHTPKTSDVGLRGAKEFDWIAQEASWF
jgi:hypothetical protein